MHDCLTDSSRSSPSAKAPLDASFRQSSNEVTRTMPRPHKATTASAALERSRTASAVASLLGGNPGATARKRSGETSRKLSAFCDSRGMGMTATTASGKGGGAQPSTTGYGRGVIADTAGKVNRGACCPKQNGGVPATATVGSAGRKQESGRTAAAITSLIGSSPHAQQLRCKRTRSSVASSPRCDPSNQSGKLQRRDGTHRLSPAPPSRTSACSPERRESG